MLAAMDVADDFVDQGIDLAPSFAVGRFCFENGQPLARTFHEGGASADVTLQDGLTRLLQTAQNRLSGKGPGVFLGNDVKPIQRTFGGELLNGPQLFDGFRDAVARPDVESAELGWDKDEVASNDDVASDQVATGWSIDDDDIVGLGQLGELVRDGAIADGHDRQAGWARSPVLNATRKPSHGATLGIGVDEQGFGALSGEGAGKMEGKGRFPCAALLGEK